ncbi:MAG: manganese-binding transcriptional regulator MntR [Hyphomicrobiales bacterium]
MTTRKTTPARSRPAAFRRTRADHQTELTEDYVEMIAELLEERGEARGTDIAQRLGVSNATVVKTLRRLQNEQLIRQEPYRAVFLTDSGQKLAEDGRRRHGIVERFLVALGVKAEVARIDAEGIEHHVSADTLDAMERYLKSRGEEPK